MDPKAGTPGVGWAIAGDRSTAEKAAVASCKATAGASREEFCIVSHTFCDGSAK